MVRVSTFRYSLAVLFTILCIGAAFGQGSTTSSLNGRIIDDNGEALIGANVVAIHNPTGSLYGNSTNLDGYYRISNMRVGGPYTITVSYTGYEDFVKENVYLQLGKAYRFNTDLRETAVELSGVEVVASLAYPGEGTGASTQISEEQIELMPTLNRNLNDYTRLTPQAKQTFDGGFSIAGINNRYNAIYIDGAVNNDVFGLASTGTNGGQTGISPISIDVLDQIQVVVSPYDVSLGGFVGGGINAVTKSGTNKLQGTAYYFMQNEKLAGKTNKTLTDRTGNTRELLDEFDQRIYGFSLGGPIIKDKVFFFANVELQNDETPVPYDFGTYEGDATEVDLNNLADHLRTQYNYEPGPYGDKVDQLEGFKAFAKLDFNINSKNNLSIRNQYTKAEETDVRGSDDNEIYYANGGVYFPSTTNSFTANSDHKLVQIIQTT